MVLKTRMAKVRKPILPTFHIFSLLYQLTTNNQDFPSIHPLFIADNDENNYAPNYITS
jgi:hypothetical protein